MAQEPSGPTPAEVYEQVFVPAVFVPCARMLLEHSPPRPGERVLDLACGSGVVARAIAGVVGPTGSIVGVDLRPGMLAVAGSLPEIAGAPIAWRQGDATQLDLDDGSFDLLLCQQGLQFFSDRPKALDEAKRVLRPGGRAAFAVWQGLERQTVFASLCAAEVRYLGSLGVTPEDAQAPFLLGEAKEISSLLAAAGFRDIDVKPAVIEANFASSNFVRDVEYAYTAFVPGFRDNPAAFDEFVENVSRDIEPALAGHRRGERVVFPMPLNIATAIA